jgi:integrase/recombinase XerD
MMSAERSASNNTLYSYKLDLIDLLSFSSRNFISIVNFSTADILKYISSLDKKKLSGRTLARKISSIKQFFKFLVTDKIRSDNPALYLEMPKQDKLLPKAISKDNVNEMLSTIITENNPEGIRDKCMLEMLYSTGMRVTELIQLKYSSIQKNIIESESHAAIIVKGKGSKERLVILNQSAIKSLSEYIKIRPYFLKGLQTDYLFPSFMKSGKITHISRQRFHQITKRIANDANIDAALVSPHKVRHSFASHLLQNGADLRIVQELLGHADISSTQIYTKILSKQAKDLVLDAHPLSKKV